VAILRASWKLGARILAGEKTIESRWLVNRSAPWDRVRAGDAVYFKESGGPVTLRARVARVRQFEGLTPARVRGLVREHAARLGLRPGERAAFARRMERKRYGVLIFLRDIEPVAPFGIDKTGYGPMAAWLPVGEIDRVRRSSSR